MEQKDENYWLMARVTYLKGLKSRSDQQELLVLLVEKTARSNVMANIYLTPAYSKAYLGIRKCTLAYILNINKKR